MQQTFTTSHNIEIVIWPQIYSDVTSPMYTASEVVTLWRDRNAYIIIIIA